MAEPSKPPIDEKTHSSTQSIGKISKTQKISKKQKSKQN
jgi:hypothetical protein